MTSHLAGLGGVAHLHGSVQGVINALRATPAAGVTGPPANTGWATITAVASSPATVSISIRAQDTAIDGVRYHDGYTPAVGDVVLVMEWPASNGADYYVLGKPAE